MPEEQKTAETEQERLADFPRDLSRSFTYLHRQRKKYIDVYKRQVIQSSAHVALAAWIAVLGIHAIDRLRQNFCAGRFARAARAGEQICVRNAPGHQFVF